MKLLAPFLLISAGLLSAAPARIALVYAAGETSPAAAIRRAMAPLGDIAALDIFSQSAGALPLTDQVNLAAYDLVFIDGAADALTKFGPQIESATAKTKVVVVNPKVFTGNVNLAEHPWLSTYWANPSQDNYADLVRYLVSQVLGRAGPVAKAPIVYPDQSYYHPDAPGFFADYPSYLAWYSARSAGHRYDAERYTVAISFHRNFYTEKNLAHIDALVRSIERHGANVVALMAKSSPQFDRYLMNGGKPLADVLLFHGDRLNYSSYEAGVAQANALGIPILGVFLHSSLSAPQYLADPGGFAPSMTANLVDSEREGVFEPMILGSHVGAHDGVMTEVIPAQVEWRVERALAWAKLRRAPNGAKRVVFTYWSEGGGKANVGGDPDDFLDVPGSLVVLLNQLRQRGYDVGQGPLPDRDALVRRMSREASNVGNWAPGELARRVKDSEAVLLPEETYVTWFNTLPEQVRRDIVAMWGPPPGKVMVYIDEAGKRFLVIPKLQFGNILIAPHPDWGYLQNEKALLSKDALPPHHQYLAFFLWLQKEWRADAWVPLFTNITLQIGKMEGPAADDPISLMIGAIPNIHPEKLGSNGGIADKRKAMALTPGWFNGVVPSEQTAAQADLRARLSRYGAQSDAKLKAEYEPGIRAEIHRLEIDRDLELNADTEPFDSLRRRVETYLAEIERQRMPYGSHVLGQALEGQNLSDMVMAMLGQDLISSLKKAGVAVSASRQLVRAIVLDGKSPADAVKAQTGRQDSDLEKELAVAVDYANRLRAAPREVSAILEALEGRRIEPGPMDEPIRQPDSLPPGRALYSFNQRIVPTPEAEAIARRQADALIGEQRAKHNDAYPQKLAFVLWSAEIAKNNGVTEAEILYLLGTRIVRDSRGDVTDVELIPRAELGRPRIDVLVTTSGVYRDHYQDKVELIAKAARLAAASPEDDNPVARANSTNREALVKGGEAAGRADQLAAARVFSPAPNAYSPNIQFLAKSGDQRGDDARMADLYTRRLGNAYGGGLFGEYAPKAFEQNLKKVEGATLPVSGNVNGLLDDPMPAGFLGGLNMAARSLNGGHNTDLYVSNLKDPNNPEVETLQHSLRRELRTRYFNPKWIEGMKEHGYDGARYMMDLTDNLELWDNTSPETVSSEDWAEVKSVYVDDKFGLGLGEFFQKNNPFAKQLMMGNLLQAADRGEWRATQAELADLARQMAESAARNGIVCEATICRNPQLTELMGRSLQAVPGGARLMSQYESALAKVQSNAPANTPVNLTAAASPAPASSKPTAGRSAAPPEITGKVLEPVAAAIAKPLVGEPVMWGPVAMAAFAICLFWVGWHRKPER